ncbi:hypothetical protein AIZ12_25475, partial [Salmonella enterica subsp. enterica serovar Typhimurium]
MASNAALVRAVVLCRAALWLPGRRFYGLLAGYVAWSAFRRSSHKGFTSIAYTTFSLTKNDLLMLPMFFGQPFNVARYDQQKYV